ncbi:MAG: TonB-dependent receptor [Cruoricaptor ignavus]|nr:TonB-dependent receptor [Cruoricaptor ignavus]
MKKLLSFIAICVFVCFSFAQKTISGKITDEDGQAIPSASVTVEEQGKDAIIAFAISNSKGEYKVTFTSNEAQVNMKVKAFNQRPQSKLVKNETQTQNFNLQPEATEIKEVKLKTRLITKRGDTISYDLSSFESKADRTLADVLQKVPGIEVSKSGQILYQGEPLNKFYVNGKDLMEGGYGTIVNSLPTSAIQKMEVMENHQPIKALQDKVPSEQAAINIKLKNKVTMTGRGDVASGFAEPWLWNVKLTPMFFGQKNQWVINYKTNNTGEAVENEGNMLAFGSRWEGIRKSTSQNGWLNVENASTPSLPEKRYLFNNVHYLSANLLTSPFKNKEWELKVNGSYTNNAVERESYSEVKWFENNATYFTNIFNNFYTDKAKGELIFTKNAKKGFFKNTTTFSQFWNADRGIVNLEDARGGRNAREALQSPTSSFQNSLSTIIPWKEKMINLQSFLSYQNDRQSLELSPASYLNSGNNTTFDNLISGRNLLTQHFQMKSFEARHSANLSFTKKYWTLTPEAGFNFTQNHLITDLYTDATRLDETFINDLKYTTAVPYGSLRLNFKNNNWLFFANLPVNFNSIKGEDANRNVSKSVSKITFEPNAFAQYSFASFWKASANSGMSYNFGDVDNAYAGYIMRTPRSLGSMDASNPIPEALTKYAGTRLEYRNPLNNLFFNLRYSYNNTKRNLLSSPSVDALGFIVQRFIERENTADSNTYSAEVGKYFPKLKSNASMSYSNTLSKSEVSQNAIDFLSKNNSQRLGFKFNNTFFSWLSADYNLTYSWVKQNVVSGADINYNAFNHNLAVYIYPKDNHTFGFFWDQINSKNDSFEYKNPFYDVSYQYTWAKKKIDFELKWMNIANRKVMETYNIGSFSESFTRMKLRPSQVMIAVKFNFK